MKRKIAMIVAVILISTGLIACGSNSPDSTDQDVPVAQESPELGNAEEETETNAESVPELEEEVEVVEEEEDIPYWYMDSEGLKNEKLGIVIKKDVAMADNFTINAGIVMRDESKNKFFPCKFSCGYYEGDLDSYISEHSYDPFMSMFSEIKKGNIGEIDYAYNEYGEYSLVVLIVENGIVFSAELSPGLGSAEEQMNKILKNENESNINNLAYIMKDGFHIPALGIMIPYDGEVRSFEEYISVSGGGEGISLHISEEKDARGMVDQILEDAVSYGRTLIEETVEINIGKYQYLGRGINKSDYCELWYFTSDNVEHYISLENYGSKQEQDDHGKYVDYISSILESIE